MVALALGLGLGMGGRSSRKPVAPTVAEPTAGTIYVSGASPSALPAGNDTTGTGSASAPYATLTKALSVVPASGGYLVLCDGTFAENSAGAGRWILAGTFADTVLMRSYSGNAANFVITNTSNTNGVINVRSAAVSNLQFQFATVRAATEGTPAFAHNPTAAGFVGTNIGFFDCVIEQKTAASGVNAINLVGDSGVTRLNFVRCLFQATTGASTVAKPSLAGVSGQTQTADNQPHAGIGFFNCTTAGAVGQFANTLTGINGLSVVDCTLTVDVYGVLFGRDTSGILPPKVTNGYIGGNTIVSTGTNAHGIDVGDNVQGAVVENNNVTSTLQGIVCKGCFSPLVRSNTVSVSAGGLNGLYAKASTGVQFTGNTVSVDGSTSSVAAFREGVDGSNKAGSTTLVNNTLNATGASATLLQWSDGTGSTGGARADGNTYVPRSGAAYGSVRGVTVASLAAVRSAWASNGLSGDNPTNDAQSVAA